MDKKKPIEKDVESYRNNNIELGAITNLFSTSRLPKVEATKIIDQVKPIRIVTLEKTTIMAVKWLYIRINSPPYSKIIHFLFLFYHYYSI